MNLPNSPRIAKGRKNGKDKRVAEEAKTSECPQSRSHLMLLKLPRELRDEIYSYLLHSDDLAIPRVSCQASLEALDRVYTKGLFRV